MITSPVKILLSRGIECDWYISQVDIKVPTRIWRRNLF
jgi:hypothetical protein